MPPEGSTRARFLPGCPSLDRGSREAEVGSLNSPPRSPLTIIQHGEVPVTSKTEILSKPTESLHVCEVKAIECAAPGRLMFQSLRYLKYRDTCIFVMYYSMNQISLQMSVYSLISCNLVSSRT
ncbi:hypothetical protein T265_07988 [Opisthorchis viverrini]|uniref:Uncharacterized protein n=1 Tax=Opisthorchis viverrini TaxID=6198 RepID=A0A074ZAI8_OPIVI|nr:hypothetical protein T265_07988 [Opisthorchis viverrini]KER24301.1 hypothetical protein T265_07988 [Opisthorchis viverrini]